MWSRGTLNLIRVGTGQRDHRISQRRDPRMSRLRLLPHRQSRLVVGDAHRLRPRQHRLGPRADATRVLLQQGAGVPAVLPAGDGAADGAAIGDALLENPHVTVEGALNPPLKISFATNTVESTHAMKFAEATTTSTRPAAHCTPLQKANSLRKAARAMKPAM